MHRLRSCVVVLPRGPKSPVDFVAAFLHPADDLAVESLLDRDVRHRAVRRGAMPMLLSRRTRDHISGVDFFDGTSPALHEAAASGHNERLTQRMRMPGGAGAGLERDARTLHAPRSACLEQRFDAHLAGEPFLRSLARRSRTASLDVHVLHDSSCSTHAAKLAQSITNR